MERLREGMVIEYQHQPYRVEKITEGYAYIKPVLPKTKTIHTRFSGDKQLTYWEDGTYISPNAEVKIIRRKYEKNH